MTQELESTSAHNTGVLAGAVEEVIAAPTSYPQWNKLLVTNRDSVDIQIQLDGRTTKGYIYEIQAGGAILIEPEDGIYFSRVVQKNLDGAAAETAAKILFRAALQK